MNEILTHYAERMLQSDEPMVALFLRNGNSYCKASSSPTLMLRTVPPSETFEIVGIFGHALVATPTGDGGATESDWVAYAAAVTRDDAVSVLLGPDGIVTEQLSDTDPQVKAARRVFA